MSKKVYEVELNFPKDMSILEKKLADVLADIVIKRIGGERSMQLINELENRSKENKGEEVVEDEPDK